MELGSLVCTPTEPSCEECPVARWCAGFQTGEIDQLGPTTKRVEYTELREAAVVVWNDRRVLVRQCGPDERWTGLWDFPRFAVDNEGPLFATAEIESKVREQVGIDCRVQGHIGTFRHGVTRYRITLDCYEARRANGRVRGAQWVSLAKLAELPLSVTGRKLAKRIAT